MPHATCTLVFRCNERMDFKWSASIWFLLASFILKVSSSNEMIAIKLIPAVDAIMK